MSGPRPVGAAVGDLCERCGCLVPAEGQARHAVWHDFVESGIAELVAATAALEDREEG